MASGTLGAEETRERPRWTENSKVYTRKFHNKANKNKNDVAAAADPKSVTAVNSANADDVTTTTAPNNNEAENETAQKDESAQKENENGNAIAVPDAAQPSALQSPVAEDADSHQQQPNSPIIEVISGDSPSLNPKEGTNVGIESAPVRPVVMRIDNDKVRISLSAANSKHERRELKRKLVSELEEVKSLAKRLLDKEEQLNVYDDDDDDDGLATSNDLLTGGFVVGQSHHLGYITNDGFGRDSSVSRPFQHLSVSVMDNTRRFEKEKRTPKANQYYRSSDFIFGTGKLPPPESNKKVKAKAKAHGGKKRGGGTVSDKQIFKKCGSLLTKLMKHQFGFIFNTPVDAKMMGLHDYYDIIKHPMDLGTVKNRLGKNWYKSPLEFAEDVRLTFRNARIYNPEGQDVHVLAVELSNNFEERWVEIEAEYSSRPRFESAYDTMSRRAPLPAYLSPPPPSVPTLSLPPPPVNLETRHLARSESFPLPVESRQKKPVYNPPAARAPSLKKPKAKDIDKRDMTFEEKQKLSAHLQALPTEKLDGIVQIIKKRNSTLSQHDDQIEVDIDSVDTESLWELDRFVTNYKKSLSKHKRKAELARQRAEAQQQAMQVMNPVPSRAEVPQGTRDDDTNAVAESSPANKRKGASGSSSSSSSSSDSGSSSSDSDSDSSSDSE